MHANKQTKKKKVTSIYLYIYIQTNSIQKSVWQQTKKCWGYGVQLCNKYLKTKQPTDKSPSPNKWALLRYGRSVTYIQKSGLPVLEDDVDDEVAHQRLGDAVLAEGRVTHLQALQVILLHDATTVNAWRSKWMATLHRMQNSATLNPCNLTNWEKRSNEEPS